MSRGRSHRKRGSSGAPHCGGLLALALRAGAGAQIKGADGVDGASGISKSNSVCMSFSSNLSG